jgi:hypothetical protein
MNRRLGHERATEADLLYAGTADGRDVLVIVECKNRPIEVSGTTILLPEREGDAPTDLMRQLELKKHHARILLGYHDIRFLVVGCTRSAFSTRVTSDVFAVGQPIAKWSDTTTEQDFSPITSTWPHIVHGVEALDLNSSVYLRLRNLPRFTPWDTIQSDQLRRDLEAERLDCWLAYLQREAELNSDYQDWLQQFANDREEGWFYGAD